MKNNNVFIFLLVTFSFVLASGLLDISSVYAAESSFTPFGSTLAAVTIPSGTSVPGCEETNSCYLPSEVTVDTGSQVTWSNDDTAAHTVTSGSATGGPDGIFDSGLFTAGAKFSYTFEEPGDYNYFCMVHPWMMGIIIVQGENIENNNSITITNIDSPMTPIKQGDSFPMTVIIDNQFSEPVSVTIRFDVGNDVTTIITPEPELIQLDPGTNSFPYNFETSQNIIPGNYTVNIQLWSIPSPNATAYFPPKQIAESNSGIITVERPAQIPQPPLNLEAKAISPYEITLSWKKPQDNGGSDIIGYKIEYLDSNLFSTLVENTGTTKTSYQDTDLKPDTEYSYRISAINSIGTSEPSNEDSATTFKELVPRISRLDTDKPSYQTDGQNDIIVTVLGQIENPHKESTIVDVTLEKSTTNSNVSSIPQRLNLKDDGTFQTQFHLDPKKFTTGFYIVKAVYDNQKKSTEFGITQNLGSAPNMKVPDGIIQTANDPRGAYVDPSVVTAEDKKDGTLKPQCEPQLGWLAIGEYTVNCTAIDDDDNSVRDSFKIKIENAHPVSEISVLSSDDSFEIDKPISFSAGGSYDPDGGTIIRYLWDFGDDDDDGNSPIITKTPEISHSYKKEGTFDVSVDVIDDENSRSNKSSTVKISVSANYIWIIVIVIIILGGVGAFVAKSAFKSKPGDLSSHPDTNTDDNPKDDDDDKDKRKQRQPSIDMDIEFGSGIEKK